MKLPNLEDLPAFDEESGMLNIIVETPRDGRTKYKYSKEYGAFQFDKTLPYGFSFPFEFGFVPSTEGGDGDPLDVLVLSDEPTFPGCMVLGKLLGVLEGEQTEEKKTNRNDRLLAIPVNVKTQEPMMPVKMLDKKLKTEITSFFEAYNEAQGKKFKPLGFGDEKRAKQIVKEAQKKRRKK